jgi:hypothetical protein
MDLAVREYIQARIAVENHGYATRCWIWKLALNASGYGQGFPPGSKRPDTAHRFTYREYVGEIPNGLHLDHLCRVRDCCNPDHLEPVTPAENARRAIPYNPHFWRKRERCQRGHELSGRNVMLSPNGERRCRTCKNEWARRHKSDRKQQPAINPRSHCAKGHELTPENTIIWQNQRRCRKCNIAWRAEKDNDRASERSRRNYQRRKAAARIDRAGGAAPSGQRPTLTGDIAHRGEASNR